MGTSQDPPARGIQLVGEVLTSVTAQTYSDSTTVVSVMQELPLGTALAYDLDVDLRKCEYTVRVDPSESQSSASSSTATSCPYRYRVILGAKRKPDLTKVAQVKDEFEWKLGSGNYPVLCYEATQCWKVDNTWDEVQCNDPAWVTYTDFYGSKCLRHTPSGTWLNSAWWDKSLYTTIFVQQINQIYNTSANNVTTGYQYSFGGENNDKLAFFYSVTPY